MSEDYATVPQPILAMYSEACTTHNRWNGLNETVRNLVRPNSPSFNGAIGRGQPAAQRIYDSTAVWAAEQLASGLHSYMSDPGTRWFHLALRGVPFEGLAPEEAEWLELTTDIMYSYFLDPRSRMDQSMIEMYSDVSSYGTGILFREWDDKVKILKFRAYPLASCKIMESASGMVDTIFRDMMMTVTQIQQEFPNVDLPANMTSAGVSKDTLYKVTHAAYPNEDHVTSVYVPTNISKRFVSVYFIEESRLELRRSGYDLFPYMVPRWTTMAGEIYGRGPAITASPDIELLQLMYKELIMAAQLANRPPMILDDDGYTLPISYVPGSLIFKTPGTEKPETLNLGGNFGITLELLEQKRGQIAKSFHVDWLLREKKKERQSVHEISDDRQEMLRQISSPLGRLEAEFASPCIRGSFFLLDQAGVLPPPPDSLKGRPLEIIYNSPAAKAKDSSKAQGITQYLADLAPMASINPEIYDGIDFAQVAQVQAVYRDVTRRVIRSPEKVRQIQDDRKKAQQNEQQTMQTQQMGQVAGALKDVATAQEKGLAM